MTLRRHLRHPRRSLLSFSGAALLAMTAATAQVAGTPTGATGIDASGNYQQEVQACTEGRSQQDRDTCLREARNARADKQQSQAAPAPSTLEANARARCDALSGEDKSACEARVLGYGNTSGSVAGGGVLREVETVVPPPGNTELRVEPKTQGAPVVVVPPATR
jgi:hypothetical protein